MAFTMMFFSLVFLRYASMIFVTNDNTKKEMPMNENPERNRNVFTAAILETIWAFGISIIAGHLLT